MSPGGIKHIQLQVQRRELVAEPCRIPLGAARDRLWSVQLHLVGSDHVTM